MTGETREVQLKCLAAIRRLDFLQRRGRVAEGLRAYGHLVHHREKEAAHLPLGFVLVVEHATARDATACATVNPVT